jgi:hypothetical protein
MLNGSQTRLQTVNQALDAVVSHDDLQVGQDVRIEG